MKTTTKERPADGARYLYTLEGPYNDQTFVYDRKTKRVVGTYISLDRQEVLKCKDVKDDHKYQKWAELNGKPIEINEAVFNELYESHFIWRSRGYQEMDPTEKDAFNKRVDELHNRFSIPLWLRHARDDGNMPDVVSSLEKALRNLT